MAIVRFNYADVKGIPVRDKKSLKQSIIQIFKLEGHPLATLNYIFCSDPYLLDINRMYLQHDYYTDVVTFDLSEKEETIGEVYISRDRVKENSLELGIPFQEELVRVIFHAALHLIGYGDKKKSEITIMREKEDYYLRLFGIK